MNLKQTIYGGISVIILIIATGCGYQYYSNKSTDSNYTKAQNMHYHKIPAYNISMKNAKVHASIMSNPNRHHIHKIGIISANESRYPVKIDNKSLANKHPTYIQISQKGRSLGWINANNLYSTNDYKLPFTYISQFWPSPAKDACEIASLKTAMTTQGKAINVPLSLMVSRIPITKNPNTGYTGNPYHYGTHATIYPKAMVQIAHQYGAPAKNISGASINKLIYEITHGKAIVFEGPFMMKRPGSDHDLTILGYRPGYFYVVDPFAQTHSVKRGTWVSTSRFAKLYNSQQRMQHALTIG